MDHQSEPSQFAWPIRSQPKVDLLHILMNIDTPHTASGRSGVGSQPAKTNNDPSACPVAGDGTSVKVQPDLVSKETLWRLESKACEIRREILAMVCEAKSGHIGGSFSAVELLVALYYEIMRHDPQKAHLQDRDRFIMSKGHCTPVLYAVLADCGYFPKEDLQHFRRPGSHLQGHPYQPKTPGVEASTGTLGLGLSTALGMALGAKIRGQSQYYYVLCGDGEIQEGQVWEAAMFGHKYKLDKVIAFVDRNRLQTDGDTEDIMPLDPLPEKWRAFGWNVHEIDGNDLEQILQVVARSRAERGKPTMIIANTIKGKGVSFMENACEWHSGPPNPEDYQRALRELTCDC
jgi:transketolase